MAASEQSRLVEVAAGQVLMDGEVLALGQVRLDAEQLAYLGSDEFHYFARLQPRPIEENEHWHSLREAGLVLSDAEAGLAVSAVALQNWHVNHTHCPRCGRATVPRQGGWSRRCPADGSDHFPRTDPAVIMSVIDSNERLLLGRQAAWPVGRYSVLAGFCEPGESAEHAVLREVEEEVGLTAHSPQYLGSQPWPFPASLMLAFTARAEGEPAVDGVELAEAMWVSRAELHKMCDAGELGLPSPVSIAHRIIEAWYGKPLPEAWSWR